jgi:tetratricopeptide (TPR) repeat protein
MSNLPPKILIIDDDATVAGTLKDSLAKHDIKVFGAADLQTAMYLFNQNRFDVVLIEANFEAMPGLVLIQKWRQHELEDRRHTGFILSINKEWTVAGDRLQKELRDIEVINKPFTAIQLLPVISKAKAAKERSIKYHELRNTVFNLSKQDKFDKALEAVKKNLPELGARGLEMMVELYENQGSYDKAIEMLDKMLVTDSENITLLNIKGRILLKQGKHSEALKFMEIADKAAPGNIERVNNLVVSYLEANEPDKSVAKMKEMIGYNPEKPDLKFDLFAQLHQYGFEKHAETMCRETTSPIEVVRHYNNKGVALARDSQIKEAIREYERSLVYYPKFKENYRIQYNIALAYAGLRDRASYQLALEAVNRCLELNPTFEKGLKTKAQLEEILAKLGDKKVS